MHSSATWGPTIGWVAHLSKDTSVAAGKWALAWQILQADAWKEGGVVGPGVGLACLWVICFDLMLQIVIDVKVMKDPESSADEICHESFGNAFPKHVGILSKSITLT